MTNGMLISKARKIKWVRHLERHFSPFVVSFFVDSISPEYFAKAGASGNQIRAGLFQKNRFYVCKEYMAEAESIAESQLATRDIYYFSRLLIDFYHKSMHELSVTRDLKVVKEILTTAAAFVWYTHILEGVYDRKIRSMTAKFIRDDIDNFMLQASMPVKRNAHSLLEEALLRGDSAGDIIKKFGWIKCRNEFSEPFSEAEIEGLRKNARMPEEHIYPTIPPGLKEIYDEARELVYYRTARTDVLYELLYRSRPALRLHGEKFGIGLNDLDRYTIQSLIKGAPEKIKGDFFSCYLDGEVLIQEGRLLDIDKQGDFGNVSGMAAYNSIARGIVRIVKGVPELGKVHDGDILVTQMTFPAYITAMQKAAAFVTDEGGITCHAAIVAREMKKPCIIGTVAATRILKDGDVVEVDANMGVVKKISN